MSKVTLRPAALDDLPYVIGEPLPYRIRAITALIDDRIIGMGGIAFPSQGPAIAFVQLVPSRPGQDDAACREHRVAKPAAEATRYPVSFHRAGLMAMALIRQSGARHVVATADASSDVAVRWLKRLGFAPVGEQCLEGKLLFSWIRDGKGNPTMSAPRSSD